MVSVCSVVRQNSECSSGLSLYRRRQTSSVCSFLDLHWHRVCFTRQNAEISEVQRHTPTPTPSSRTLDPKTASAVEIILHFGRELHALSIRLKREFGKNEANKKALRVSTSLRVVLLPQQQSFFFIFDLGVKSGEGWSPQNNLNRTHALTTGAIFILRVWFPLVCVTIAEQTDKMQVECTRGNQIKIGYRIACIDYCGLIKVLNIQL